MAITSLNGLLKRTQELAKEQANLLFDEFPHAMEMGMGWYPGRMLMQQEMEGRLRDCLPDLTGVVIPYYREPGVISHLVVCEVTADLRLNRRKRSSISTPKRGGANRPRLKGIFGIQRIVEGHKTIQVCQSELTAARLRNAVVLTGADKDLARFLAENTARVNLVGESQEWYDEMLTLAKGGVELTINGNDVTEHYNDEIYKMLVDKVGASAMATRLQDILKRMTPAASVTLLAKLEANTKFDFSKLLPTDMQLFRNEREFYDLAKRKLTESGYSAMVFAQELVVHRGQVNVYRGEASAEMLGHHLAADMGYMDMLAWAHEQLKNIPHFYMYHKERLEPRYEVSKRIAQVVLSVLIQGAIQPIRKEH